jgi:DNA polymerase I-like protein with 3'-5' exonuclease and polymerase domains
MAAPGWLRKLIRPGAGKGLTLIDWAQQEFGIAAALSRDQRMLADYQSGDPYLALAERYGGDRDVFKACAIGVLNGMGVSGLARRINCSASEARLMLQEHRAAYPAFWRWSDSIESHAFLHGRLQSVFGWGVTVKAETNPRFLRNFQMQANGAEMLRLACCLATEKGVTVCAPNHDAILIEAPLEDLADAVKTTEAAMAEASEIVLDGFPLRTSVTTIRYPDHYPHPKSDALWSEIDRALTAFEGSDPAHQRDAPCARTHPRPISFICLK